MLFALRNHGDPIKYCNLRLKSIVGIDETSSLALLPLATNFRSHFVTTHQVLVIGFGFVMSISTS
jgi:hypothetical protein